MRRAHERNRIKRLARESFRLNQPKFGLDIDVVVMPKVGIETITNAELYQQLDFAWQNYNAWQNILKLSQPRKIKR